MAIKHALAPNAMPVSAARAIQWAQECGFELLPLELPTCSHWSSCPCITAIRLIACWWPNRSANRYFYSAPIRPSGPMAAPCTMPVAELSLGLPGGAPATTASTAPRAF